MDLQVFAEPLTYTATGAGNPLLSQQFTRNDAGQIVQKNESILGETHSYGYTYDTAGRLARVTTDGATTATYTYDGNGNRLPGTYDDQDRMLSYGGATYTYTPSGELASKTDLSGLTTYAYDELGKLTHVSLPNGEAIEYVIDGQNRRVGKKVNGALVRQWLYGDQLRIVAELDGTGTLISRFVYGSRTNVPDYMIRGGTMYRIISDHLGSPRLITESTTGSVAQWINYDTFGAVTNDTNAGFQPFGFAGGLYDPDTRLVHFGARDYEANSGRWTTKEPLGFGGGMNFYAYAFNDPINFADIDGLRVYPSNFVGPLQPGDSYSYAANLNDPRLVPLQYPTYGTAPNYYYPPGTSAENQQQCVSFTRAMSGAPCTRCWRAGQSLVGNNIPAGTAVATFVNGRYPQDNVPKNSGIYLYPGPNGIVIIDQWPGHSAKAREVRSGGGPGRSNDANAYSVITAPAGECGCGSH